MLGGVSFHQVGFSGDVWFGGAQFSGPASFTGARFSGDARFSEARFSGPASFSGVRFCEDALFGNVQFSGEAWFNEARFSGAAWFDRTQFSEAVSFTGAQFAQAGQLGPLLAATKLVLDRAHFTEAVLIDAATFRLSCVATTFARDVTLRVRFGEIVLDGAVFAKPSTLAYAEDTFSRLGHLAGEDSWLDETPLRAKGRPPRPRLLSLRRVDVSALVLADIDLSACLFHGAHHLDQLRVEGARLFGATPGPWQVQVGRCWLPVWWRWSRRQTLAEEHHWRAKQPSPAVPGCRAWLAVPRWHGPACQTPDWVAEQTGQQVQRLGPERVAVLYRQLRKAQEDSKHEPGGADFYYREMEMRRKAPSTPWSERFILWW